MKAVVIACLTWALVQLAPLFWGHPLTDLLDYAEVDFEREITFLSVLEWTLAAWGLGGLLLELAKRLDFEGRYRPGKKPACLHHWSDSLPLAGLWLIGTALLQSLLWSDQPTNFFSALPVEALEIFSGSIIQAAMQHQEGKDHVYCLPMSALHVFALSALQFLLGSTSDDFCFQESDSPQPVSPSNKMDSDIPQLDSDMLGSDEPHLASTTSAAMQNLSEDPALELNPQPAPLRKQSSISKLTQRMRKVLRHKPATRSIPSNPALIPTPSPALAPNPVMGSRPKVNPTTMNQEEPVKVEVFASVPLGSGANDSITNSHAAGVGRASGANLIHTAMSSNIEKYEGEQAAVSQAAANPKGLKRISSSLKEFKIKAFRRSRDTTVTTQADPQEEDPVIVPLPVTAKKSSTKKMVKRLVPARFGGSSRTPI